MCLPFIFSAVAVSAVPMLAHEVAEEHAEHQDEKHHRRRFRKPMSHSVNSAEDQAQLLAGAKGGAGTTPGYVNYDHEHKHRHHHHHHTAGDDRQEDAQEDARRKHAHDKFDDHALPATVKAV